MGKHSVTLPRGDRWHGAGTVDPNFTLEYEDFWYMREGELQIRQRPTKVEGYVWDVGSRTRKQDVFPLADYLKEVVQLPNVTYSIGGHLIAVRLTGVDSPLNMVGVSKRTNDKMQAVENAIGKSGLSHLTVEVTAYYDDKDSRIPKTFRYAWTNSLGTTTTQDVTQDWMTVGQYGFTEQQISSLGKLRNEMIERNWRIESQPMTSNCPVVFNFLKGYLPAVEQRPYAVLDYLLLVYGGTYGDVPGVDSTNVLAYANSVQLGGGFNDFHRVLVKQANVLLNNNWLKSDVTGRQFAIETKESVVTEQHSNLLDGGGSNAPQVDHIIPESLRGPNCFSNARLTSMQFNVQRGQCTQQFNYHDETWRREMLQKLQSNPELAKYL